MVLVFFRLGVVTEVSFELLDIIDMMTHRGMWDDSKDSIHSGAYISAIAHHLPGLCLVFPLNLWCSCVETWQRCALALELGGGVSILLICFREMIVVDNQDVSAALSTSRRRRQQCLKVLLVDVMSLLFLIVSRFLIVTPAMYQLILAGLAINCKTTYALIVGAILMTIFNLMWLADLIIKVSRSASQGFGWDNDGRLSTCKKQE